MQGLGVYMNTFGSLIFGFSTNPLVMILVAVLSALVGMFAHWSKKQYRDDINIEWYKYFFVSDVKSSIHAVLGMLAGLFAAFAPIDYTTISLYQVVMQSFVIGYSANSALNNASQTKPAPNMVATKTA